MFLLGRVDGILWRVGGEEVERSQRSGLNRGAHLCGIPKLPPPLSFSLLAQVELLCAGSEK